MAATYLTPGVYIEEQRSGSMPIQGVGTSVAAFIGFTEKYDPNRGDPTDPLGVKPQLVTNWPQYERIYGGFTKGAMLPFAVKGFFDNGGTTCFIVRVPTGGGNGNGNGNASAQRPAVSLPTANPALGTDGLKVEALQPDIHLEVEVVPPPPPAEGQEPPQDYTLRVIQDGAVREEVQGLNFTKSARVIERAVREQSHLIALQVQAQGVSLTELIPPPGRYPLVQQGSTEVVSTNVAPSDLEGSESERTGYQGLAVAKDVTMVAICELPVIATREDGSIDEDLYLSVQGKLVDWCQQSGRMAILDTPPKLSATRALEWRTRLARDSAYGAMYYPNVVVDNPLARPGSTNGDRFVTVSPVGHIAGIWARNDATRGVWKAPANEPVLGITRLETDVTDGEQALLNPDGVNCIRSFGVNGMRVWGARTLSSSDPSWRYVNVRRLFNFIEESIRRGTLWAVFEPNNQALWGLVRRNVTSFLRGLSEQGAFATMAGAPGFYVMCDERNNPPHSIDDGKLIVEIGVAPSKPAEFVIFRISQLPSGGSISE